VRANLVKRDESIYRTMGGEEHEVARETFPFHAKTKEEVFEFMGLGSDLVKTGLTSEQAQQRLEKYGPNKLTEKEKVTLLQRIWNQIANVLVAILAVVAIVSLVQAVTTDDSNKIVSNWIQFGLIVFVVT